MRAIRSNSPDEIRSGQTSPSMHRPILASIAFVSSLLLPSAHAQELMESSTVKGAATSPGLTLAVSADLKQHQLYSPTALAFDDQGRILVAETHRLAQGVQDNRSHLYWYLDDLASKKTSDRRALHEKWKKEVSIEKLTAKSEVVRRLADTDGDGKQDESKVFADGFNDVLDGTASGVFHYEGAVYLACIPKLLMLRDTDGDGVADDRRTIADGFGVHVSLSGHDMNGFALGPDGRIYGSIGDRGFSLTTKEGVVYDYPNEGAVFRFEPDGSGFEVFHAGLRNPKEIAFDALGNPFTVDNNSDQKDAARVVYLVEGGDSGWEINHQAMFTFHRQIGLQEMPPSRWMNEKMWHLATPEQPAYIVPPNAHLTNGPAGLTVHPGTGFLENEANRFLICDYRGSPANSAIWSFAMKPDGAGMKMTDSRKLLTGVAVTDAEYSWDGRLFITDFAWGWQAHDQGRLLSLDAGKSMWRAAEAAGAAKLMREGMEQRSAAELANLLRHPDARIRLRAQIALTRKPDALKRFKEAATSSDFMVRVHGIWGLGILARRGSSPLPVSEFSAIPSATIRSDAETALLAMLNDKNEEIRCQVLRTLADATVKPSMLPLGPLLADPSARVRFFTTMLIGKRTMLGYYGPVCDMLAENNNRDPLLRHAGAYALQRMVPNSDALRSLSSHESVAVRLAAAVALRRMKSSDVADFIRDKDTRVADEAIRAVCDTEMTARRPSVANLLDDLSVRAWTPFMLRRLLHNSFRIGDARNADRVLNFAADDKQPEDLRKEAFRLISIWCQPPPADQLTGRISPLPPRDPSVIKPLLEARFTSFLGRTDFVLAAALGWTETYGLESPTLDLNSLRALVGNAALSADARAKALSLVIRREPPDLKAFLMETVRNSPDEVSITALSQLAAASPADAVAPLEAALASGRPALARKCWELLAAIPGEAVDALFVKQLDLLRDAKGISSHAIELTEAAKKRKVPAVGQALKAFQQSLTESTDPLAKWNYALEGGDAKAGHDLFSSHPGGECMRCHRVGDSHDVGGETAPNLAGIANRHSDRRFFLEAMLEPSAAIAPGFGTIAIDFKNGTSLNGNVIAATPEHIDVDYKGKAIRVSRSDVAEVTNPVSPMPDMRKHLKPAELRDLVAWLASLKEDGAAPPAVVTPEPFDPASLTTSQNTANLTNVDPAVMKSGRTQFIVCGACHGQNGEGTAAGPPLAGSEWVNGPVENLIRIQLRGLQGPITVKGQTYNFPAPMAALAYQTDEQIAAVLSYVRNSFGNSAPAVTAAQVAALRSEVGKPTLSASDLVAPKAAPTPVAEILTETKAPGKYDNLRKESGLTKWLTVIALIVVGLGLFLRRSGK
jgi:quinoprotein glucose dehydrogenase